MINKLLILVGCRLQKILTRLVTCRCAAIDFRGHGSSVTLDDEDLSADTLAR